MMVSVEILVNEMSMSVKVPPSLSNELTHTEHFRVTQNSDYANTLPHHPGGTTGKGWNTSDTF